MSSMIRRVRLVTRTTDPDVAATALARTHDALRLQVRPEAAPFRFEETVVASDRLSLESTACTGSIAGVVSTGSHVVVTWMKSGRGSIGEHRARSGGRSCSTRTPSRCGGCPSSTTRSASIGRSCNASPRNEAAGRRNPSRSSPTTCQRAPRSPPGG
ncbi:hypothetical protein P9139_20880 [Curtobacterium flaccumfaciens]|nr:hypothetical protein P9139_20880 [Curtobacterium flaccumfaciens]